MWRRPASRVTLAVLVLLGVGLLACESAPVLPDPDPPVTPDLALLFVGNSLTYYNDLPGLLAALVDSAGLGPIQIRDVSVGGYGLQDHWITSRTRNVIDQGGWDLIIIQQGPSATEGRPSLLQYSTLFAGEAREGGAEIALYMVWPSLVRFGDFDGVLDSYRTAAENENGLFFPAGEAWRVAWETDPSLAFFGPDDFHPSLLGTYIAALVMFEQITGRSPVGLPSVLRTRGNVSYSIGLSVARSLQEAAQEVNHRHARTVEGWPPEGTTP
jgi:hypothetical protein